MTASKDEIQSLVTSIGECAVSMIGKDHLHALTVNFDMERSHGTVTVALPESTDDEQLRAFSKLSEVEMLFFEEATLDFRLSDAVSMKHDQVSEKQLAYRV